MVYLSLFQPIDLVFGSLLSIFFTHNGAFAADAKEPSDVDRDKKTQLKQTEYYTGQE